MLPLILKRTLGAVTILLGASLIGWFLYNQFRPTDAFREDYHGLFQLFLPLAMLYVGWQWLRSEGKGIEEVVSPDWTGPELDRAREKAVASLPEFIRRVESGTEEAYVKFPLRTPQGLTEHIWAYVHFHRDSAFNVSLANEPFDEKVEGTAKRNVSAGEVEDWQIVRPDGTIDGAFSLIALFESWEGRGKALTPRMKKQKAQLRSAP